MASREPAIAAPLIQDTEIVGYNTRLQGWHPRCWSLATAKTSREAGTEEAYMTATWMSWCGRHWCLMILAAVLIALLSGLIPSPWDVIPELAARPEVRTAFQDPMFGKQDAMLFLFSFLFFGPFASFIGFFVILLVLGVLGAIFLPLGRLAGLPEWFSTALYVSLLTLFIYMERDAWAPGSLWFLGLVARAWVLVMS
jgi:hypothetical protein